VAAAAAHSEYSASELREMGFPAVEVIPYVTLDDLYHVEPDPSVLSSCRQGEWTNLICVAQVAPHKRIEDCLFIFDHFKRHVRPRSRLVVIGDWSGAAAYMERLKRLIARLCLTDVVFTGQVTQAALAAYFQTADALLCMSEHEGFCVPLVEAARYKVPIFAYSAAAVPEILCGAGVLFEEKEWPVIAEAIGLLLADEDLRRQVVDEQSRKLKVQSRAETGERLQAFLANCRR
jgi:glycosyltransferase involved in cell wall biosynthesis